MKKIRSAVVTALLGIFIVLSAAAQVRDTELLPEQKQPSYVAVNENMAVNLIFPYAIKRAQWVSPSISVQQFKGVDNILLLKANKKDFPLTNVSVVTTDGHFYNFVIGYSGEISVLNLQYKVAAGGQIAVLSSSGNQGNEADIKHLSELALKEKSGFGMLTKKKNGIRFSLEGIFINGNTMLYRISVKNSTNVQYDIDQLRFYIRDEKKSKRTASQEIELTPVYRLGESVTIKGKSAQTFVYALKKFTIPDRKYMTVEIMEKSGGRNLVLKVKNSKVLQAKTL